MKKTLVILFLLLITSSPAQAWKFNYTYADPAINSCPPDIITDPGTCQQKNDCCVRRTCISPAGCTQDSCCTEFRCDEFGPHIVQTSHGIAHIPNINETCFRPSCYWKVAILVNKRGGFTTTNPLGVPVQPLTTNTGTISRVIDSLTQDKVDSLMDLYPTYWSNPPYQNHVPNPNYSTSYQVKLASGALLEPPKTIQYKFDRFELSTGTSAMQGLLWSWRMLSDKWLGVWTAQSDYEDTAFDRSNLPNQQDSKNIIIISDGLDSDGPDYAGALGIMNDPGDVSRHDDPPSGIGYVFPSGGSTPPIFHTCDANAPLASITDADYNAVCQKMAEGHIKVNVVLYGYQAGDPSNERLHRCADTTGGQFIPDATPQNINQVLQTLFASIAQQKIRLIK